MRAWAVGRPGPIDGGPLDWVEREAPEPGPGQVRVRVSVCGVCRTDLHLAEGDLDPRRPGVVPGHEVVGRVDRVGPGCTLLAEGDRIGIPWLARTCGTCRFCTDGRENLCLDPRFTGWDVDGGYAEYAVVDERLRLPRCPRAWATSRRPRCSAPASSATGPCGAPSCPRAGCSGSTASGARPT